MKIAQIILSIALIANSCSTGVMPAPTDSKHITTEGAGFMLAEGNGKIQYVNLYTIKTSFPNRVYATVAFENTLQKGTYFTRDYTLSVMQKQLRVESRSFGAIKNGGTYKIKLSLYSDPNRSALITEHVDTVKFSMPDMVFDAKGLKRL